MWSLLLHSTRDESRQKHDKLDHAFELTKNIFIAAYSMQLWPRLLVAAELGTFLIGCACFIELAEASRLKTEVLNSANVWLRRCSRPAKRWLIGLRLLICQHSL